MSLPARPVPKAPLKSKGRQSKKTEDPHAAMRLSRKRGALLGLCVGDAMGQLYKKKKLPTLPFPEVLVGPHVEMRPGGPNNLKRGQVGDDSNWACALANSLLEETKFEIKAVIKAYLKWRNIAFDLVPQTRSALQYMQENRPPDFIGRRVWIDSLRKFAENDCLSRGIPIAVYYCRSKVERIDATLSDAGLTHFDFRSQLAAIAVNAMVAAAIISTKSKIDKADLIKAAETDLALASVTLAKSHLEYVIAIQEADQAIREDIRMAQMEDPLLYGPDLDLRRQPKFARTTLRLALWHVFHSPSVEVAVIDVANRGGDSDTLSAVTGALMGAIYGESSIPEIWSTPVKEALNSVTFGPRWTQFHPRHLLEFADATEKSIEEIDPRLTAIRG